MMLINEPEEKKEQEKRPRGNNPSTKPMTSNLPLAYIVGVGTLVERGHFLSKSEVMRTALRDLFKRDYPDLIPTVEMSMEMKEKLRDELENMAIYEHFNEIKERLKEELRKVKL